MLAKLLRNRASSTSLQSHPRTHLSKNNTILATSMRMNIAKSPAAESIETPMLPGAPLHLTPESSSNKSPPRPRHGSPPPAEHRNLPLASASSTTKDMNTMKTECRPKNTKSASLVRVAPPSDGKTRATSCSAPHTLHTSKSTATYPNRLLRATRRTKGPTYKSANDPNR